MTPHPRPAAADTTLPQVTPADVPGAVRAAFAGLLGRGHPWRHRPAEDWGSDPGTAENTWPPCPPGDSSGPPPIAWSDLAPIPQA